MISLRRYFKLGDTSYKELAKRAYKKFSEEDCPEHAAAMAYYFLFASFPFLLFLTTLIAYLPVPHLLEYVLDNASRFLPGETFALIKDNIQALFTNKKQGLLSTGIVLALWASSNAIVSVMDAMNNLYDVKEGRPFWKVRLIAIGLVVGLSLLFLLAMAALMFGNQIGDYVAGLINFGGAFKVVWFAALVPVTLFVLILAIAVIYYFTPDVEHQWVWISPGAVIAIPSWIVMSLAFSYYINNFGSYDKTYGSIGAVIVLLLWLYLTGLIILAGAVINSVIEHSSAEGKKPGEKVAGEVSAPREDVNEEMKEEKDEKRS
ncbi:Inner membrane protein YihY, formerly thought to be RNase BN [Citrifermentans bremense]|uniref:Inner membrane protein YihY, formerly thought to be RNase BN n=1 Tax=Citrifermentans bremense TaxID=60035 RepID=A0A6S6LUQ8_9BACT|nr:YihY/virulence factor BrkB family protein [Citrifermentans bremense]BCG45373.1 Inner membrane protein YihY, formerly thought to be RNase BN [Citrifermentans bremense]